MTDLRGSHVVIIGGSSGLGLATAQLVQEQGASVTIASRSSEKLQHVVQRLDGVRAIAADITSEADVQALFSTIEHVDHVFISAARPLFGKIMETELETFRGDVDQRFWGLLFVVRHAAPKMRHGSITFTSGQLTARPGVGAVVTAAILAAVETLAKGLALELAPIRVNVIAPGVTHTPFAGEGIEEIAKWAKDTLPVKRIGRAEEIAQAVVFLMTNDFMTGEVLHIDGGERLV